MTEVRKTGSPQKPSEVQSLENASQDPAQPSRTSSLRDHLVANNNNNNDVKIDIQRPQQVVRHQSLKVTQDKIKFWESNRRYDRIVDIARLLEDSGLLTKDEKDWLKDLGDRNYAKYCQLGDMLQVRMIWRPGHHGVWDREDRNKLRMQTMKAVLYEAMTTYDPDGSYNQKMDTIDRALAAGKAVRNAMTARRPYLRNLNMHKDVTKETLRDPRIFVRKCSCKLANEKLYAAVQSPRAIHPDVSERDQERAAKAVEFLINNDLLDKDAAEELLIALADDPQQISALVSDPMPRLELRTDREKTTALALLALAYNDGDTATAMKKDLLTFVDGDAQKPGSDMIYKAKYRLLPDLRYSGGWPEERNEWIAWAKSIAKNTDIKSDIPDEPIVEEESNKKDKNDVDFLVDDMKFPDDVIDQENVSDDKNKDKQLPFRQMGPVDKNKDEVKTDDTGLKILRSENAEDANTDDGIQNDKSPVKPAGNVSEKRPAEDRKITRKLACATLAGKLDDLLEQSFLFTHIDPDYPWTRDDPEYTLAEKDDVFRAVTPLLKNNLLTPDAALGLEKRLTNPEVWQGGLIAFIESATNNPSVAQGDRQKVRSLLYLGFAFATKENYKRFEKQARKEFWVDVQAPKPAYKSLPNLPRSGGPEDKSGKAWLSFWKTIPNPVDNDLKADNNPKDDHSLLQQIDNNNKKDDAKVDEAAIRGQTR